MTLPAPPALSALLAEVVALREALERIADARCTCACIYGCAHATQNHLAEVARAALLSGTTPATREG